MVESYLLVKDNKLIGFAISKDVAIKEAKKLKASVWKKQNKYNYENDK